VFDLGYLFRNRGFDGYGFVVHETFHGMQGELADTYGSPFGRFFAESSASFGADMAFPATQTYSSPYTLAHALPLNYFFDRDAATNPHFQTTDISFNNAIRGGHIYAAFLFWSFLSNHVGIPHVIGKMHSIQGKIFNEVFGGELLALRIYVESEGFDLGDLFGIFVAHLRTWDYQRFADSYAEMEQNDFNAYSSSEEWPLPPSRTLESLKVDVVINPDVGTSGDFVSGPEILRPGQFGWNCLTAKNVGAGKFVTIKVVWDRLGRDPANPSALHKKQDGCDEDIRFYNSMVVAHNLESGGRRYWKLKGKSPPKVVIDVGSSAPVTIHILMIPTPPADYVDSQVLLENELPVPAYSYKFKMIISGTEPIGGSNPPAEMKNGIVKFESATNDWWSTRCTCTVLGNDLSKCTVPIFDSEKPISAPSSSPSRQSTDAPTAKKCKNKKGNFVYSVKKNGVKYRNCSWLSRKSEAFQIRICKKKVLYYIDTKEEKTYGPAQSICQLTCNSCSPCYENPNSKFFNRVVEGLVKTLTCKQLKTKKIQKTHCKKTESNSGYGPAKKVCPKRCSIITKKCSN